MIHKIPVTLILEVESDEEKGSIEYCDHEIAEWYKGDEHDKGNIAFSCDLTIFLRGRKGVKT